VPSNRYLATALLLGLLALPQPALAYIGPGVGIGAIAVTIAFFLGIFLLLAGFVWYPLKRMFGRGKPADLESDADLTE
jgi:hypothetical protein